MPTTVASDSAPDHTKECRQKQSWLNRTVLGAGITSALGDLSYETSNVVLPGFLAVLGAPAAALGAIEGIADAVSSFTKMGAGYIADRLGHRKSLVVSGYAFTTLGQALMAVASGWPLILAGRVVGWFGRGVRGPLRDAIVAEAITAEMRGRAFGFHRAADTAGAVVGPLIGVALLSWAQGFAAVDATLPFRLVFWLTLIPGALSVLSFALLVRDDRSLPNPALHLWSTLSGFPPAFRRYLVAVGIFGAADFAHTLLILAATQLLTARLGAVRAAQVAGLLYVARNATQALASYPIGAAADRWGHVRTLALGYVGGVLTAALIALAFFLQVDSVPPLALTFVLAGLYVAAQEALEPSVTANLVPAPTRGIAYATLGSVNGVGKLVSSTLVGVVWTAVGPVAAFGAAATLMAAGSVAMARVRESGAGDARR
jgi:MFS family permease